MKTPLKIFVAISIAILSVNLFWFISPELPLEADAPLRLILGGVMIFLVPGLLWGEALGFRSTHPLETIALSLALTLTASVIILPLAFLFKAMINLWVSLIFIICLTGIFILILKQKRGKEPEFLGPLLNIFKGPSPLNISTPIVLLVLILLGYGTYRWGENLTDIGGEKLLQMVFVRYYYSMPMVLDGIGLYKGASPLNIIHLWEYLIAGWASLINVEPLFVFYRARFVIPLLGFSGLYLLIKSIYPDRVKSEIILWLVLIMSLGGLMLTGSLSWIKDNDPFRGVMLFMGTVHHSDSAMDILIALSAALVLMALRRPGWRSICLLGGTLFVSFMWHAREFFQTAVYTGVFGIALLISRDVDKRLILKRGVMLVAVFLVVALFFGVFSTARAKKESFDYSEFEIKKLALRYAFMPENIAGIRYLFKFPMHMTIYRQGEADALLTRQELRGQMKGQYNPLLWLLLSAGAIPLLALWGDREDRHLSLFYVLLWFLALCWNFSMLILIVLTYSEIHMSTPRILYIFSYVIMGAGVCAVFQRLSRGRKGIFIYLSLMFVGGILFWLLAVGTPLRKPMALILSIVLSVFVLISFIRLLQRKPAYPQSYSPSVFMAVFAGALLFFYPIVWKDFNGTVSRLVVGKGPSVEWFGNKNPFQFSPELIGFLRALPPQNTFLSDISGNSLVSVYAPQYHVVQPASMSTIVHDMKAQKEALSGRHPLLGTESLKNNISHHAVKDWLDRYGVDYILVEKKYYTVLRPYFEQFSGDYHIVFNNEKNKEMIIRYRVKLSEQAEIMKEEK